MSLYRPGMTTAEHIERLRHWYVGATPRQRLGVILQRLEDHHFGPNRLVTSVSAVEGLARALLMAAHHGSKTDRIANYPKYRMRKPTGLIEEYLRLIAAGTPSEAFGADLWRDFVHAIEYRNILAHECAYLGMETFPAMINACECVMDTLINLANIKRPARGEGR